jgi:hypothetical protein
MRHYPYLCLIACLTFASHLTAVAEEKSTVATLSGYHTRSIEGWTVQLQDALLADQKDATEAALVLLQKQLAEIVEKVPAAAVGKLREVTLWFSVTYADVAGHAEYHPDGGWLRSHGRNPAMAKGVEFTNVKDFGAEMDRMPNFALHELAHAYHDRVLSFEQAEVKAAYAHAQESKLYEKVARWHGTGKPTTQERAYGITDHKEYFAEATEAFFGRNDFFPFTRAELKQHDPDMFAALITAWGIAG